MGQRSGPPGEVGNMAMRHQIQLDQVSGWRVTSQATDQVTTDDAGNIVKGTLVRFITQGGDRGSVFVPDLYYNAKTVHQMISIRAATIDAVGALAHETFTLGD